MTKDEAWRKVYPVIGWEYDTVIRWSEAEWAALANHDSGTMGDMARERQVAKLVIDALIQ